MLKQRTSSRFRVIGSLGAMAATVALAVAIAQQQWLSLFLVGGLAVTVLAIVYPFIVVVGLVFAVSLSPELPLGLPLRIEDFIVVWGLSILGLRALVNRPLWPRVVNWQAWAALLVFEALATVIGVAQGTARLDLTVYSGLVFWAKSVETFLLYALVVWLLDTRDKVRTYVWVLLLGGVLLGGYGMVTHLTGSASVQGYPANVYVPVVDPEGGPTYSLIAAALIPPFALSAAMLLVGQRGQWQWPVLLVGPIVYSIVFSLSRQGYAGAATTLSTVLWVHSRRLLILLLVLFVLFLLLAPSVLSAVLPLVVVERISPMLDPFTGGERGLWVYQTRLNAWRYRFPEMWKINPITGRGLASVPPGYLDSQYLVNLYYTGFLGLGVFLWLLFSFGGMAWRLYAADRASWERALGLAGLGAVVGFLVTGLGGSPFVAVRAREMFWLLMAGVAACSSLGKEGLDEELVDQP